MATLAQWRSTIVDEAGNIQPSATVTVRRDVAGAPLATIYSDRAGATPVGNPITAGVDGFVSFHVIGGVYRITTTLGAFTKEWRYVAIGRAAESDQVLFGVPYLFDDATADADPGDGQLRFNNAAPASVTTIYIDLLNALAADMTTYIGTWDDSGSSGDRGVIIIMSRDGTNYWMGTVTGSVTTATGYRKLAVTYLGHAGTFLVDEAIGVVMLRRGTDGSGDVTGPGGGVVDNEYVQYSLTTGKIIKGSGGKLSAVNADVRAAVANRILTADLLETASVAVALTDAATVAVDWDTFIYATLTIAGNRALGNPTNIQEGTWRTIWVNSDAAGGRQLAFSGNYVLNSATLIGINQVSGRYLIPLFGLASPFVLVGSPIGPF